MLPQDNLSDDDIKDIMRERQEENAAILVKECLERGESIELIAGRLWARCKSSFLTYWGAVSFVRREYYYSKARRIK